MQTIQHRRLRRGLAAALSGGILAGASCSSDGLRAFLVGLDAAVSELEGQDDISFGDWLESELDDL